MKKSTLLMVMGLLMALVIGVTGTMAYLTDTDSDVNVMVMGNVDIEQHENDRDGNEFEQNQTLLPIVGSAADKDENGYPAPDNYIDKIVTVENTGMIGAENIAKMKDGAILLNTARGPLVDEAALAAALASGKLRGAACDVISAEPMKAENPLKSAPNCIVTPHMAWAPIESRKRIQDCTERSIQAFLAGSPINTVNM